MIDQLEWWKDEKLLIEVIEDISSYEVFYITARDYDNVLNLVRVSFFKEDGKIGYFHPNNIPITINIHSRDIRNYKLKLIGIG
jgi:hypothetical protein